MIVKPKLSLNYGNMYELRLLDRVYIVLCKNRRCIITCRACPLSLNVSFVFFFLVVSCVTCVVWCFHGTEEPSSERGTIDGVTLAQSSMLQHIVIIVHTNYVCTSTLS